MSKEILNTRIVEHDDGSILLMTEYEEDMTESVSLHWKEVNALREHLSETGGHSE